jgi:hypothetical protein
MHWSLYGRAESPSADRIDLGDGAPEGTGMEGERFIIEDGTASITNLVDHGWRVLRTATDESITRYEASNSQLESLQIIYDQTLGVWYLNIQADDNGLAIDSLRTVVRCCDLHEVLSALESTDPEDTDQLATRLRQLGAIVPAGDDARVLSAVTHALSDPRPAVLLPGILVALYWQHPSCLPALEPLTGRADAIGSVARSTWEAIRAAIDVD